MIEIDHNKLTQISKKITVFFKEEAAVTLHENKNIAILS